MGPAIGIFRRCGLEALEVSLVPARRRGSREADVLLEAADSLLEERNPDAVITGLSGPDLGLDEALVARAGGRPTYALQDYWGDVNPGFGRTAGTFFVPDEYAARLTRQRLRCRTVVSGSPRHAGLVPPRREMEGDGVLFCGQPLWHLPGYPRTLEQLGRAVRELGHSLHYRPHPAETPEQLRRGQGLFERAGLEVDMDGDGDLYTSLCGASVVASCYSSCGLDLAYLNRAAPEPLGGVLCVMVEPDLRRYYRDYSGLDALPLVELGLAGEVTEPGAMAEAIMRVSDREWRHLCQARAREVLPPPERAAACIAAVIRDDLSGRDHRPRRTR